MIALRNSIIALVLCLPLSAHAGSIDTQSIRSVQSDSTDVFAVLSSLQDAEAALGLRDYIAARQGFELVLLHDPNLAPARAGLRRSLIATGDFQAAAQWIDDINSVDAVIIHVLMDQTADSETIIKTTLETQPDPRLWTLLGKLRDEAKDHAAARQAYAMAELAGARPGLAENNIGQSHWLQGEIDLALKAFSTASKADPADMQFDNNRRRALISSGQTHDAVAGLNAERAGIFLAKAADHAVEDGEIKLAKFLYAKSLDLSPRHDPGVAEKLARLNRS